jgi:uncharacterized protein (UPF0305 family)
LRKEFEQWMFDNGKAKSTIAQYSSTISYISKHYSKKNKKDIDLYKINDINFINVLVKKYGKYGEYEETGNERSGAVRAAIAAYAEFLRKRNPEPEPTIHVEDKLEVINKALNLILPVLSRYICKILIKKDRNNWWKKFVIDKLKDVNTLRKLPKQGSDDDFIDSLDIPACLNIIECNWIDVFRDKMDDRQRTWAHVLRDIRNYYQAHYTTKTLTTINAEDISLELAIMIRFIRPIDIYVTDRISEMKKVFENKFKDGDDNINNYKPKTSNSRDYSLYFFNDEIFNKRQLVLAVFKNHVRQNPNITLNELQNIFDKKINGQYNIVDSYDIAKKKYPERYFFNDKIVLDQDIVVCNQWGKDNITKFISKAKELGYNIIKKED